MKLSIVLILSIFSFTSFANEIITASQQIENLQKKLRENPYYRKIGPLKFEIFYFDIGKPTTPFYEEDSQIKRFYKNEKNCFELVILENKNLARKTRCLDKARTLYLKGFEEFKVVEKSELIREGLNGFTTDEFNQSFKLLAYLQSYDMFSLDRAVYGGEIEKLAPKKDFNVYLKGLNEIRLNDKEFEITQKLSLAVDKIGWLPEKSVAITNSIKKEIGGLIFTNGQGRVLIYNPYIKSPFGTHQLKLNTDLPAYLNKLAQDSQSAPVCFRDSYTSSNQLGCHEMIFKKKTLGLYEKVKILEIDFVNKQLKFR
jgi:hypothetical protein